MSGKFIAQVNIAKMKGKLEDPVMKEFADFLEPINKLADESPGFIWRLKDENGASAVSIETSFEDPMIIVNMSVWKDIESLKTYVYQTVHSYFLKNRAKWFDKIDIPHAAFWWVEPDHLPDVQEAIQKLKSLELHGPSNEVFGVKEAFTSKNALTN